MCLAHTSSPHFPLFQFWFSENWGSCWKIGKPTDLSLYLQCSQSYTPEYQKCICAICWSTVLQPLPCHCQSLVSLCNSDQQVCAMIWQGLHVEGRDTANTKTHDERNELIELWDLRSKWGKRYGYMSVTWWVRIYRASNWSPNMAIGRLTW